MVLIIYKSFIRPHIEYRDVIRDQLSNASFSNKTESAQFNPALAVTGAIKGSSCDKLYQELALKYIQQKDGWNDCDCSIIPFNTYS